MSWPETWVQHYWSWAKEPTADGQLFPKPSPPQRFLPIPNVSFPAHFRNGYEAVTRETIDGRLWVRYR